MRNVCIALVFVTAIIAFGVYLHRSINPVDTNKLVMILQDDTIHGPRSPARIALFGKNHWFQELSTHGSIGPKASSRVYVYDIRHAWFDGDIRVTSESGEKLALVSIKPRSRFGPTLVIIVKEGNEAFGGWNEIPGMFELRPLLTDADRPDKS
ncbi:hypothetical protein A6X21_12365 [Planctopirus hydrillae]|uniref:Uncharacterized protein n=1 Tax=Planctopirus hydrillae TaxID=1841610 RepID=A0A1C3E5G8_9PLAN|nr:hypothetical protein A6X21_12365 [Planctopirus hydrillae]